MLLTRALDDRISTLSHQGRIGISGSARGHEAAQVASAWAIRPGQDVVFPYYRDIGVALTLGLTPLDILLGALDKATDPFSGGRQMPFHFTSVRLRMPTPSTSIATQIPHAVGAALASRLRGEDAVTDHLVRRRRHQQGRLSRGDQLRRHPHAARRLHLREQPVRHLGPACRSSCPSPASPTRAAGYGVPAERCDGMSVQETYAATRRAVDRARAGGGPSLVEAVVYRLGPHTSHDDDTRYRTRDEVASWEAREPIGRLRGELLERGLVDADADAELQAAARREIDEALEQAEAAPEPDPAERLPRHPGRSRRPEPVRPRRPGAPRRRRARAARASNRPGPARDRGDRGEVTGGRGPSTE